MACTVRFSRIRTKSLHIRLALNLWADPAKRAAARPAILERASHFDIATNVEKTLAVLHQALSADALSGKMRKT